MVGKMILLAMLLGVAIAIDDQDLQTCYNCTGSMYRLKGSQVNEWQLWTDDNSDYRCMDLGEELLDPPPSLECEEKPDMVTQCNIAQATYEQEYDGEMIEIKFVSRGCNYVTFEEWAETKEPCVKKMMPAQPGRKNFKGTACDCQGYLCNTGTEEEDMYNEEGRDEWNEDNSARQATLSVGLLAGVIAAALLGKL